MGRLGGRPATAALLKSDMNKKGLAKRMHSRFNTTVELPM